MDTSILIARLMGPTLVLVGLAALANRQDLRDITREFLTSRALV